MTETPSPTPSPTPSQSPSSSPSLAMVGWTASAAGAAAQQRALDCRRRIDALRAERPFDQADAGRAKQSLELARMRAAAAEARRRRRVARLAAVKALAVGRHGLPGQPPGWIAGQLHEHGIAISALFERYFALGGEATLFDVDGHVHGVITLPSAQQSVLEHALWELIELTAD